MDDDSDDDFERGPRRRKKVQPHWFFRYVINLRGVIALACLVGFLAIAGLAMWAWDATHRPPAQTPSAKTQPSLPPSAAPNQVGRVALATKPADWSEFADPEGWFTIWLPPGASEAAVSTGRGQPWDKAPPPREFRWQAGDVSYRLSSVHEEFNTDGATMGVFLKAAGVPLWFQGDYDTSKRVEVITANGRRVAAASFPSRDDQRWLHTRGVIAGKRGYALYVVAPKVRDDLDPLVAPFLDGLRITAKGEDPPVPPKKEQPAVRGRNKG